MVDPAALYPKYVQEYCKNSYSKGKRLRFNSYFILIQLFRSIKEQKMQQHNAGITFWISHHFTQRKL